MLTKSQRIPVILLAWAFLALGLLTFFQSLNAVYFFELYLIGLLVTIVLSGSYAARPKWRTRANVLIVVCFLAFCAVVAKKAMDYLMLV